MSEKEKQTLERQKELLYKMSSAEKQAYLAYGEGLIAGKELAAAERKNQ